VHENDELHNNNDYRRYQAWYQGATRCNLRQQWTTDDYVDIDSSNDEDTAPTLPLFNRFTTPRHPTDR
jgi:hypothetical protein